MSGRGKAWIAAAAAVLLIVIVALLIMSGSALTPAAPPVAVLPVTPKKPATPTTTPARQLHVGLYISKNTGDRIDGYSVQIVNELSRGKYDLVPILEPGTASEPAIARLLTTWFAGKTPLDVTKAESLKALDVIVAPRIWFLPDDARAAIEAAVTDGTGLLARNGLGCMEPGSGEEVSRLSGFSESQFGYNAHPMACEMLAPHPLLGKLSGQTAKTIMITPNGTWGVPGAKTVPLIRVKDMDAFRAFFRGGGDDWTFYPLYVAELGKGKIVGCQWPAWEPMPKDLAAATDNQFNLRAIEWLARSPSTKPTATR
jgi:hypothetical protein